MKSDYSWKMKGLSHGVDPSTACAELKRLENIYGSIKPEIIVSEAKNPESPLHPIIFNHNDKKAAYLYRLELARKLLNNIHLIVITDGETKEIAVFEVTTCREGYKSIDTFTPDDIEYIKISIQRDLFYLKKKLQLYKEFDKVLYYINQAIEIL